MSGICVPEAAKVWACVSLKCDGGMTEANDNEDVVECHKCGLRIKKPMPERQQR